MIVVNILAPIFLLIGLGLFLRRQGFASEEFFRNLNRLIYWIALPALLFTKTASALPQLNTALGIIAVVLAGMVVCIGVGYLLAWRLRLDKRATASFVQGAYRGNIAFVGLPVVLYALAAVGQGTPEVEALVLLALAPVIPVYNVAAVIVLAGATPAENRNGRQQVGAVMRSIATNPLIIACLAGLAIAYSGLALPEALTRTLDLLGELALPGALLAMGAGLRLRAIRTGGGTATAASLVKVLVAPLAGYLAARMIGLTGPSLLIAMLLLAMPTAVASYVMAQAMGADDTLASSIVMISTLLAIPVLSVILLAAV
ncbi:MAG: AEC family transporter [Anaerolineae bacterium]|nr:AEC family transporter [Anaerolineae bacterium]MCB0244737.1 AEC family transporter [Anaerolineae bacterium]MCB9129523.1 AEC family transporter [Anaerolineales bacterium]MCO5242599.1 AEC family transporter [Anaerolineae bacterium]